MVAVVALEEEGVSTTELTRIKAAIETTTLVKPEEAIDFIDITIVKIEAAIETTTLVKPATEITASAIEFTAPACHLC